MPSISDPRVVGIESERPGTIEIDPLRPHEIGAGVFGKGDVGPGRNCYKGKKSYETSETI